MGFSSALGIAAHDSTPDSFGSVQLTNSKCRFCDCSPRDGNLLSIMFSWSAKPPPECRQYTLLGS